MKTFNRGKLRRLAEQGRLELADSYHFDDMMGVSQTTKPMPVGIMPADWHDKKDGVCYVYGSDFSTKSGTAWENPNGSVTLIVHGNSNYTFRIV